MYFFFFLKRGGGKGRPLPLNSTFSVDTSRHILIFPGKKTNPPLSNTLSVTVKTLSRCLVGLVYALLFLQTSGSRLLHTLPRHQLYKMMRNDILSQSGRRFVSLRHYCLICPNINTFMCYQTLCFVMSCHLTYLLTQIHKIILFKISNMGCYTNQVSRSNLCCIVKRVYVKSLSSFSLSFRALSLFSLSISYTMLNLLYRFMMTKGFLIHSFARL